MSEQKVQNYKITPEMKVFMQNFKKINRIGAMLQQQFQIQLGEANRTRDLLRETEMGRQLLLQNPPKNPTFDLEGQDELSEESMQINY